MTDKLCFNGINGVTGDYLLPEMSVEQIARVARGESRDEEHIAELKRRHQSQDAVFLGAMEGIDATRLAETGWGVVFAFADGDDKHGGSMRGGVIGANVLDDLQCQSKLGR